MGARAAASGGGRRGYLCVDIDRDAAAAAVLVDKLIAARRSPLEPPGAGKRMAKLPTGAGALMAPALEEEPSCYNNVLLQIRLPVVGNVQYVQ